MPQEDYEWITNYWPQPTFALDSPNCFYPDVQMQNAGQHPQRRPLSIEPTGFRAHLSTMSSQNPIPTMSHPTPPTRSARSVPDTVPGPGPPVQQRPPPAAQRPPVASKPRAPQAPNTGNDIKRRRVDGSQTKAASGRDLSGYSFQPHHPTDRSFLRDRIDIVRPFDKRNAAEKTSYDPTTIARDILVASGRHPTEPALNHHLSRLRDIFNLVDNTADLETIRWDIVDTPNMQVRPTQHVKPETTSKPMPPRPDATQPSTSIEQPPAQQACPAGHSAAPPCSPPPIPPRDQTQPIAVTPRFTPPLCPPAVPVPQAQQQQKQHEQQQQKKTPKPKQQQNRPQTPDSVPKQSPVSLVQVQPPKPSPPPQKLQAISLPQLLLSPAKSNKSMPSQTAQRSRPPKRTKQLEMMTGKKSAAKVEVSIPVSAPPVSYPVFACAWQNCQAELHNLELLRHHLLKSHIPYTITCSWSGCDCKDPMAAAELFNHVKSKHLDQIAWKLGDGPSVPQTVDNTTCENVPGIIATPELNQLGGEDSLIFPASYSSIRAFNRVHGNTSQQDKAREILKAVQRHKERIGVGLDPGGCQLATPARNERVSNDEEFYELYSDPEDGTARESESEMEF